MITAHVNEMGIVLRFDSASENLSHDEWESLLDELKSHYIPSSYGRGKRSYADFSEIREGNAGRLRVVIYFTPKTGTLNEAVGILEKRNITVSLRPKDEEA